jgi:hypothetical protein
MIRILTELEGDAIVSRLAITQVPLFLIFLKSPLAPAIVILFFQRFSPLLFVNRTEMGGGRDFFSEEKTQMWCWIGENVKTAEIARRSGRHFCAVMYNSKNIKICSKNMID